MSHSPPLSPMDNFTLGSPKVRASDAHGSNEFMSVHDLKASFSTASLEERMVKDAKLQEDALKVPMAADRLQILRPSDYTQKNWKNGLGATTEIAIQPPTANFHTDPFLWRLSATEITDSFNFSLFPSYEICLLLLPEEGVSKKGAYTTASLHHHDYEKPTPLKTLVPYSWLGEWPTSCKVTGTHPLRFLTFINNRLKTRVSYQVETIVLHSYQGKSSIASQDSSADSEEDDDPSSTNTMLMGNVTILHVITGSIKVSVDGGKTSHLLEENATLICERGDGNAPTDVTMTPLLKPTTPGASAFIQKGGLGFATSDADQGDATLLLIQVHFIQGPETPSRMKKEVSNLVLTDSSLPPMHGPAGANMPPRPTRTGSVIVFDDQPMWNVPKLLIRRDSDAETPSVLTGGASSNLQTKYFESAQHYRPPVFSDRFRSESEVPPPITKDRLVIEDFPAGQISTSWINMVKQGLSEWIRIPVIIARGVEPGPVIGITAVVHGNELNGVPCIHRVITDIDVSQLKGAVVAVPCVNVPGYLRFSREFSDGKDLNRYFPGTEQGTASSIYNHNFFTKIIKQFNFLIDLHTASFGRVNSYYVRADMNDPVSSVFAKLQQPQVILHNSGQDGTLRSAASSIGIKAITVEIGNPQLFQNQFVQWSYKGVMRILAYLNMFKSNISDLSSAGSPLTILCSRGFWMYTQTGGVLEVYPLVNSIVKKGDLIARIKNIFGNIVDEIFSTHSGVTIGRSSNPVAMAGDRILHLGIIKKEHEVLAAEAKENY
ncbi:hypothetical protein HDU91_003798 [Kappamyces sp. JEL0680]|nr:hypothetical protein HDU91_003798 [Kappamyces sp. JEL0680]